MMFLAKTVWQRIGGQMIQTQAKIWLTFSSSIVSRDVQSEKASVRRNCGRFSHTSLADQMLSGMNLDNQSGGVPCDVFGVS
mmetsp:Transcript_80532/g.163845  ORF Transcript_80532/g.163845 Transcript_80532/m.163845 type:complete len:81 (+) Transcript_80532:231-473(+)